jgi:hypothetical protein
MHSCEARQEATAFAAYPIKASAKATVSGSSRVSPVRHQKLCRPAKGEKTSESLARALMGED